jgi:hypothetical protein
MATQVSKPATAGKTGAAKTKVASKVDYTLLRANQASIIGFLALAWLFNSVWIVAFVAAVMLVGSIAPRYSLFKWVAQRWLEPKILKPDVRADIPQPHLFAQLIGAGFLIAATAALLLGASTLGWVLVAIVVVLAGINLFLGFCAGCFMYYQLGKLGVRPHLPAWG